MAADLANFLMLPSETSPNDAAERFLTPSRPPPENIHSGAGLSIEQSQIGVWRFTIFAQIAGTSLSSWRPKGGRY
jgi:hypothetical protein